MFRSAAIFGQPVVHSRSPLIHGAWLKMYGISGAYFRQAVTLRDLPVVLRDFGRSGLHGANLTLPLKEAACAHVELDEIAAKVQAVNTIWLEQGRLRGTNTDVYGFTAACDEQAPDWRNSLENVIVLGAGGAAKAVVYALLMAGAERIVLINRTKRRAEALSAQFADKTKAEAWEDLPQELPQAKMLVNATSLGMQGGPAFDPDIKGLAKDAVVADIVNAPPQTRLLQKARAEGYPTVDGIAMLLHQAAPAFACWFGVKPQVTKDLREQVIADLQG